jgi:hypothetical protein
LHRKVGLILLLEFEVLLGKPLLELKIVCLNLTLEEYYVGLELDNDLFFIHHNLCDLAFEMSNQPLLGLKLALKFLVGCTQLLVFDLNFVEELLNPHKVVHIVLELGFLELLQGLFHE